MLYTHALFYTLHLLYTILYTFLHYTTNTLIPYIHIIGIANTVRKAITLGLSFALFPERNVLTLHHIIGASVFIFGLVLRMVLKENSQWLNTLETRIPQFTTRIPFLNSGNGTGVWAGVGKGGRCRHDSNILTEDDDTTSTYNHDILANGGQNYDSLIEIEQGTDNTNNNSNMHSRKVTDYGAANGIISSKLVNNNNTYTHTNTNDTINNTISDSIVYHDKDNYMIRMDIGIDSSASYNDLKGIIVPEKVVPVFRASGAVHVVQ